MATVRRTNPGLSFVANGLLSTAFVGLILCQSVPFLVYSQFHDTQLGNRVGGFSTGGFSNNGFSSSSSGGFSNGGGHSTPQSPCPGTFQYQSNGYETYGVGQIQPGQYEIGQDILMMAHLIVSSQLPSVSWKD